MELILAIDQSTSATKALLYEASGRLIDREAVEHRQIYPRPGWVEHDPEEIWRNTLLAVRQLLERHAANAGEIACVSLSNQRETVLVFDRQTGRPLHNAIVWQCRRGDPICREVLAAGHGEMITARTGLKVDSYFSASKVAWLMRDCADVAAAVGRGDAVIGTMDTYLVHRLTRGQVLATDHTNASRTLLFDIYRLRWDEELCGVFAVPAGALADVRDCTANLGQTDIDGLLPRPVPICGVMGDSQAALFAHRCFDPGDAKVTLGSGSSVLLNIGNAPPPPAADAGAVTTVAWTHRQKATYCLEGIINYSAATIGWLKDQLGLLQSPQESEALARSVPDTGGVYLVPAFSGLSAPYWEPDARAAIVGMTAHTARAHVVRAALEAIAYQVTDVLEMMRQQAGVELRAIHADGGATRNAFLMQFIADLTGVELRVSSVPDCSPLGAAMAGAVGIGRYGGFDELRGLAKDEVRYEPAMPAAQAAELRDGWRRAVGQVLVGAKQS